MAKRGLDQKEQVLFGTLIVFGAAFYHLASSFNEHAKGCEKSSNRVSWIGLSILIAVVSALILSGINTYHGSADTTQRIERTVEETHKK